MSGAPTLFVAGLLLSAPAAAQGLLLETQTELHRLQREMDQNRSDVDRLFEQRLRHDLGLPMGEVGDLFRSQTPTSTDALERARVDLRDQDLATANLLQRHDKLKGEVDRLQALAEAELRRRTAEDEWSQIPHPGNRSTTDSRTTPQRPVATDPAATPIATLTDTDPAVPPAVQPPPQVSAEPLLRLGPIKGQIHGSEDHSRVAAVLFQAGQALMDRAFRLRRAGRPELAAEFDAEARERLSRAIDALGPVLGIEGPRYPDLFTLGKCREALFRIAERQEGLSLRDKPREFQQREQEVREPFLEITVRDVEVKKGVEMLGKWGRAAQAALDQFRWMNLHGGFTPSRSLESITWENSEKR